MKAEWVIYAFLGFFGYFGVNILLRYVAVENPLLVSLVLYGSAALSMFFISLSKMDFSIQPKSIIIAAIIGICSVFGTVFGIRSIKLAPNPGYAVAIYSSSFVLVTLLSVILFKSQLTFMKLVGVLFTFIGLVLLSI